MINSIFLKNFLSYEQEILHLLPGLNIVSGGNGVGKSNFLRAVNWVFHNRPLSDNFRSFSGGDTEVCLDIDNQLVGRLKAKKDNLYYLNDDIFKAFNKDVPAKIKEMLNVFDGNFHWQLSAPFLLSESAVEVAKYFNKIVNLEVIDGTIYNISSSVKAKKKELVLINAENECLTDELKKYNWIEKIENDVCQLEKDKQEIIKLDKDKNILNRLVSTWDHKNNKLEGLTHAISFSGNVCQLESDKQEIIKLDKDKNILNRLVSTWDHKNNKLEGLTHAISFSNDVCQLEKDKQEITDQRQDKKVLDRLVSTWENKNNKLEGLIHAISFSNDVCQLEKDKQEIIQFDNDKKILDRLVSTWDHKNNKLEGLTHAISFSNDVCQLEKDKQEITDQSKDKNILDRLVGIWDSKNNKFEGLTQAISFSGNVCQLEKDKLEIIQLKKIFDKKIQKQQFETIINQEVIIDKLFKLKDNISILKKRKQMFINLNNKLEEIKHKKKEYKKQINNDELLFESLMPEICPLCNNLIVKD